MIPSFPLPPLQFHHTVLSFPSFEAQLRGWNGFEWIQAVKRFHCSVSPENVISYFVFQKALSSFSFFTFIRRLILETTERTFVEICGRMRYKNLTYSRRAHPLSQPLSM